MNEQSVSDIETTETNRLAATPIEYRRELLVGMRIVLYMVPASIIIGVAGAFVAQYYENQNQPTPIAIDLLIIVLSIAVGAAALVGWIKATIPSDSHGEAALGGKSREVLRTCAFIALGIIATSTILSILEVAGLLTSFGLLLTIGVILAIANLVVWIVQFFSSMRFMRHIADAGSAHTLEQRIRSDTIKIALLSTVGIIIIIGPLIAIIMLCRVYQEIIKLVRSTINEHAPI